ncbi:MAG: hypothetical protein IJT58_07505 [Synergistaceae bacterium]|nr:hypothetical protein [Synergistaceae bacterium]
MKSVKFRALLGLVFIIVFAGTAFAGAQDFVLVNRTGYDIYVVNISPTKTNDWEEDILGSDILENGEEVQVRFGIGNTRYWDIQAIFEDESSISWYGIDLLETFKVTLRRDGTAELE